MKILISNPVVIPLMGLKRGMSMTQVRGLAKHCAHGVLYQPSCKGVIVLGVHADPWLRLHELLDRIPRQTPWPRDGWILLMELRCPHCGETRMVEIQQSHKGTRIVCDCCGRDAPHATAAGTVPTSGTTAPSSAVRTAG